MGILHLHLPAILGDCISHIASLMGYGYVIEGTIAGVDGFQGTRFSGNNDKVGGVKTVKA